MTAVSHSGPARVVASGEVTSFFGHPLEIQLGLPEGPLVVSFSFQPGSTPSVDSTLRDGGWSFTLTGFDDDRGRGSAEPVLLAELEHDLVFLHFRAFRFGATPDHTLHYTCFRVPKAAVGWTPTPKD